MMLLSACANPQVRQNVAPASDARAQYQKARMAWELGDLPAAFETWTQLLSRPASDPLWPTLAHLSAYGLEQLAGEMAGEAAQEKRLAAIDDAELPHLARRRLLGARAWYARRRGDEAEGRRLDRQAGAIDRWWMAGPYGGLPRLGLQRPFPPDEGGDLGALREVRSRMGQIALEAVRMRTGVQYAVTWVKATRDQRVHLVVDTDQPWRLFVDGNALAEQIEETRYPPHLAELDLDLEAGWHRLTIKVAAPGGRADLTVGATANPPLEPFTGTLDSLPPLAKAPERAVRKKLAESDGTALGDLITAEESRLVGDGDAAERAVTRLIAKEPKVGLHHLVAALAAIEDETRPATLSQDRARRRLQRASALEPRLIRARYLLATLDLGVDRARDALVRLDAAPKPPSPLWRLPYMRYQALKARGWNREAEDALLLARKIDPEACPPLQSEVMLRREKHEVERAVTLAEDAARCNGGDDDLANTLRDLGKLDGALAEYERLLAIDPSRETWLAGRAEALAQSGRAREAAEAFAKLAARYPRRTSYWREHADALIALGQVDAARKVLVDGLAEAPESTDLHRAHEALCQSAPCSVIDPFRVDGREVIAAYLADLHGKKRPAYQSPSVIVLDRTVTRVFATGARLTVTHNIIQVLTKDGIDKWGEVTVPEGADVLTLRTVKADGSTREPEEILEKQSVSVPDLEPGDFVEFEYVDPAAAPAAFHRGFLAERFFFRSYDAPLDRTEYVLATPAGMKLDLDARGDAPKVVVTKKGDLEIRTWSGRYQPQSFQEPAGAPFAEFLPSVRASSGLSFAGWRDFLRDNQFGVLRQNVALTELAAQLTQGKKNDREKLIALDTWVRRHIKGGGSLDEQATSILAAEEGNRVTLLRALLRAAGVVSEIALVRPVNAAQLDGELPDLEGFDQPVLLVAGEVVDPRHRHSATGFVSPALRGGAYFTLADGPVMRGQLPPGSPDARTMKLTVALAADGSAEVTAREELRGWPALQWREALNKLAPDRVRPEFEQHTLGFYFPGSTLRDLTWSGENDDEGLFVVEYKFHAAQLARRIGGRLLLPAPYPATLGKRYVGVARRATPLMLDYASPTTLSADVKLPAGFEALLPSPIQLDTTFGRFSQALKKTAEGFRLDAFFSQPQRRVPPDQYRELVEFSLKVDLSEARAAEVIKK
jgi:tetratricopeptide (TPR) repeat protein